MDCNGKNEMGNGVNRLMRSGPLPGMLQWCWNFTYIWACAVLGAQLLKSVPTTPLTARVRSCKIAQYFHVHRQYKKMQFALERQKRRQYGGQQRIKGVELYDTVSSSHTHHDINAPGPITGHLKSPYVTAMVVRVAECPALRQRLLEHSDTTEAPTSVCRPIWSSSI